jgi:autophagy-related protein 5
MFSPLSLEVSQEVWKGSVPISFKLAPNDLSSTITPDDVYVLAPRLSYIPVIAADVVDFLRDFAVEFLSDVWFEFEGLPLRWLVSIQSSMLCEYRISGCI